ncbi:MAG: hypothetical protein FWF13_01065 [Acidobacteria bacterium]|nr:hypothetical protein [Acidobacteriota bacterium]
MKRRDLLTKGLPVGAAVLASGSLTMQTACSTADAGNRKITVLNPAVTEALAERVPLAPRLSALEGKTIYLVDTNYEGMAGTPVMEEMQGWFTRNMPQVKTVFKLKSGNYAADDPELWKEIAEKKGDGVIIGVAG